MLFKSIIRTFCDRKAIDPSFRNYVLNVLKNEKCNSGLTYSEIAKKLNKSEIYTASVFNGEHPVNEIDFEKIYKLLLSNYENKKLFKNVLTKIPIRGQNSIELSDPTVYRLNEIIKVYGTSIKELIEEKAGNGIMSAIDCKIDVKVVEDEQKTKRIEIKINGKFLKYDC